MLKQLVELAKAKKQVNIAFTYLTAEKFILGIAPANAGNDKIAPFLAKGSVEEIETQLAGLDAFIAAALAKKTEPVKEADPDEEGDGEETAGSQESGVSSQNGAGEVKLLERKCRVCHTLWTDDENGNWPETDMCQYCTPAVEPAPEAPAVPAAAPVVKQPTFNF